MTVGAQRNGRRSVGALFRDLAEESVGLVRSEIRLALASECCDRGD